MRIVVTGGAGQLGRELAALTTQHEIVVPAETECDILDPAAIARTLDAGHYDALINCAAYTKVDAAENDEAAAYAINATGPKLLAQACAERAILFCHVSTDYVFDGTSEHPIAEDAPTNPLSAYGRTKLAGENFVREYAPRHQIVRTSWLYGQAGPNFVLTMLKHAQDKPELRVVDDQYGGPTWTGHLAPRLVSLLEKGVAGTYHLTGAGVTTWCGFAQQVMKEAGLNTIVTPIPTSEYPTPAQRPMYSVLANNAWLAVGGDPMPSWQTGLTKYMLGLGHIPALTQSRQEPA